MKYVLSIAVAVALLFGVAIQARADAPFRFLGQSAATVDTTPGTPATLEVAVDHNGETIYVVITVTTDTVSRSDIGVLVAGSNIAGQFSVNNR
jgi:hypothetical protein